MAHSPSGEGLLDRAARILRAFDAQHDALSLTEIARRSGLAASSAHRLVAQLVAEGLLDRAADGRYRTGLRLWELATRASPVTRLRDLALPYLEELHALVGQHALLGVLDGVDVLQVERLSTREAVPSAVQLAGRLPWYACSAGIALAAAGSDERLEELLAAEREPFTGRTPLSESRLREAVGAARASGVAVLDGATLDHASGAAAAVRDAGGEVPAALWTVFPSESPRRATIVAAVGALARALSAALREGAGESAGPRDTRILSVHRKLARRAVRTAGGSSDD